MEELLGRDIRIVLNSTSGIIVISGNAIKMDEHFILVANEQGNVFVSLNSIKTIEYSR
jgi:RNase P/RNase MRP subunit p29